MPAHKPYLLFFGFDPHSQKHAETAKQFASNCTRDQASLATDYGAKHTKPKADADHDADDQPNDCKYGT